MRWKFIVLSWSSCLFSSKSWDDATNQSHRLIEWKHRLSAGQEFNPGAKRRKHFTLRKFQKRKRKAYRWKAKSLLINSKVFWRGNAGIRVWNRSSRKSASRPDFMNDFMCLAKRFNAVFKGQMTKFRIFCLSVQCVDWRLNRYSLKLQSNWA